MTRYGCVALLLSGCSGAVVSAVNQPKLAPGEKAEFSLTQKSNSQPERGLADVAEAPKLIIDQSCSAESCEGELTLAAVAELKKTAAQGQDCYERELKSNVELEGKVTLLLRLLDQAAQAPCQVKVESSTFSLPATFEACLREVMMNTAARAKAGCVDVALPLSFVRQEIEVPSAGGAGGTSTATGGKTSR